MGHWIRTNRPEAWNALSGAVNAALTDAGRAEAASTEERYKNVPADVTEEFVCDKIGEAMENPSLVRSFARALEARGAGLGRRVLMAVRDFLERVREFFTRGGSNPYVRKYDALSREVGRILAGMERAGVPASESPETERFSIVTNEGLLKRLDGEKTIKVYRAAQVIDGKLYPPMAAKVGGEMREIVLGKWEQADERPDLARNGKFKLDKANGSAITAAYNPYFHTSRSPLNDQFSSAYKRPNLVTLEVEVPESELSSGYRADGAKDAVGEIAWHSGPVSSRLSPGKERKVILTRYDKPVRIVPDSEVAGRIAEMLEGENVSVPENVVTPSLRGELEKRGVAIGEAAGKRRYSFTDATPPSSISEWGNKYDEQSGKGAKAVEFLLRQKSGYVPGAFHRDDIGDIAIVYGKTGEGPMDKGGYGLAHIIKRHGDLNWNELERLIQNGQINYDRQNELTITDRRSKAVIGLSFHGEESPKWVVSAYGKEVGSRPEFPSQPNSANAERALNSTPNGSDNITPETRLFLTSSENFRKWRDGEKVYSIANYPAFHAWTGDWEDRNIYGKLHGDPVASVENGVIKVEEGERGVIDAAKRWMSQHPQEPARTEIGDVVIDVDSMQGSMSHSRYQNKLTVIPILKEALEKGEYLGALPDWTRSNTEDHYFAAKVKIGGDDKILFIRVLEPKGQDKSLYVHEIYTDDELANKNGDGHVPGMQTGSAIPVKTENHSDFFRKVIRLFYLSNPESTKAVDSNGRPMVVWRRDDELINVYDFSKTQKTDAGWLGKGFYFYGDKVEAERATGYGKHLRGFYIDAKNPYYMSDEEHDFLVNADSKEKSADFTERLLEEGYDSVYYNGDLRQEWVVFEPSQIKLADETTYDDNGSPIPSYMRFSESDDNRYSITDNPNFRKWFGSSKVVDEDGEPLVVYRGASFNPLEQPDGKGVIKPMSYFSADPGYAKRYGGVQAYYLRIEHPFDIRNPECRKDLESVYPGVKFARGKSGALDWAEASTVDNEFLEENFPGKYDGIIFDEASDWADDGKTPKWRGISYVPPGGGEG